MKNEYLMPLKPCPWCKKTPEISMYLGDSFRTNGTWLWYIYCENIICKVKPRSPHVAIRNTTKKSRERIKMKLIHLENIWNDNNDYTAYEGKLIDIDEIINEK